FWTAMDMASQSFLNPQARLAYQLDTIQHREKILEERQREFEIREKRLREQEEGKGKRQDRAITSREGIAERAITSREGIAARAEEGRRQRAEDTNAFRNRIATVREQALAASNYYRSPEGKAAVAAGTASVRADQTSLANQTKVLDTINGFSRNE